MTDNAIEEWPHLGFVELFAGVGGFRLGLERVGWRAVWSNQWEPASSRQHASDIYVNRFGPENHSNEDIGIALDRLEAGDLHIPAHSLVVGGFPCQDISVAGKGEGIEGERSGLWFEMLRLISGIRPRYALIENVPMLIHRGFGRVVCDLAQIGYDAEWQIISAANVGAPHLRKRIWIVAYAGHLRRGNHEPGDVELRGRQQAETAQRSASQPKIAGSSQESQVMADTQYKGYPSRVQPTTIGDRDCTHWQVEPDVGRVADGVPKRVDRLRALGNAVCVPLVIQILVSLFQQQPGVREPSAQPLPDNL